MSVVRASHAFLGKSKGPDVNVVVLDSEGTDVTPQSLFSSAKPSKGINTTGTTTADGSMMASMTKETVADVLNNLESMTSGSWGGSAFGKSALSQTASSKASKSQTSDDDEEGGSVMSNESFDDKEDITGNLQHLYNNFMNRSSIIWYRRIVFKDKTKRN